MIHCACRDCSDTAVANTPVTEEIYDPESEDYVPVTTTPPSLCWACEEAGCLPNGSDDTETIHMPSYNYDCQREDSYDADQDPEASPDTDRVGQDASDV